MINSDRVEKIRNQLIQQLNPTFLEIIDESHGHIGHAGAQNGGHFKVKIAAAAFKGKSKVATHQMIYNALGQLMKTDIHALSIEIITSNE